MKTNVIKIENLVMASVAARLIAVAVLCVIALSGCEKEEFKPELTNYDTVYYEYTRTPGDSYCLTSDQDLTPRAAFIKITAEEAETIFNDFLKLKNMGACYHGYSDSCVVHKSTVYANKDGYMRKEDNGWFVQMSYVEDLIRADVNKASLAEGRYGEDYECIRKYYADICEMVCHLLDICRHHGKEITADVLYWDFREGSEKEPIKYVDSWTPLENYISRIAVDVNNVYLIEK